MWIAGGVTPSVRKIILRRAGHFKLFARHLIEFNYSSSLDISKIRILWVGNAV